MILQLWGPKPLAPLLHLLVRAGLAPVSPKTKRRAAKTRPFEKRQTPRSQTELKAGGAGLRPKGRSSDRGGVEASWRGGAARPGASHPANESPGRGQPRLWI